MRLAPVRNDKILPMSQCLLGIDTGGTYTDAVLLDEAQTVVAKAKALTTHGALELGISEAIGAVLNTSGQDPAAISLVSVSTTLATNAVVEGVGRRVCAVLIGLEQSRAVSENLRAALRHDEVVNLTGGHDGTGEALHPLELAPLETFLKTKANSVSGFAVTGYFSVRNPEHELAAKALIESYSSLPVTCSHELAFELNAPKRSLTCVLNARLIGMISVFIAAVEASLKQYQINAPLMLVKGDGSLVAAQLAKERPIETVYSGPAASLVGACHLAEVSDAMISDIGGTTTDIALLRGGRPKLSSEGVTIGPWQTFVKAVDMRTYGLGGDSEVALGTDGTLSLGPRRVVPLSLLAQSHSEVEGILERHLGNDVVHDYDGRFALTLGPVFNEELDEMERAVLGELERGPQPLIDLLIERGHKHALKRLVGRKLVALAAFTPSDAAHCLGLYDVWNGEAAELGAQLFARQRTQKGERFASSAEEMSERVLESLTHRSADLLLRVAFAEDGLGETDSRQPLIDAALTRRYNVIKLELGLNLPVVALGASAATYYPAVGTYLNSSVHIPEHAEVANAVGAVVGLVRSSEEVYVAQPDEGTFRVHLAQEVRDFSDLQEALEYAESAVSRLAKSSALAAGAAEVELELVKRDKRPVIEGEEFFVESRITATAFGRPSFS